MKEIEYFGMWNPKKNVWWRSMDGNLLWWPDLSLVRAYRLNHDDLPVKLQIRRILETGEPDLTEDYQ
jgi:hypothetical protein